MSRLFNWLRGPMAHAHRYVLLLIQGTNVPLAVLLFTIIAASHGSAQEPGLPAASQAGGAVSELPDAPLATTQTPAPSSITPIGSHPNLHPLSPNQKFIFATKNAFGLPSAIFAAAGAGVNQAQALYPEFHQGAPGYARYYWHSYTDQAVDSYAVDFLLPAALHQDPRYYRLGQGGAWKRTEYSFSRLFVTRSDSGTAEFNTSQVLGSGLAASISSLYYPQRDRTASFVNQRWASNLAGDGLLMVLQEFTPDFNSAIKSLRSYIVGHHKQE
ncbi:hypothetical protein ACOBR2_10855 [Telmatobacter bradus]|uniref:hypothetical protein n=1 Tax=Telmatobacter bradus TaxID=474953 RepID=UPI003B429C3B